MPCASATVKSLPGVAVPANDRAIVCASANVGPAVLTVSVAVPPSSAMVERSTVTCHAGLSSSAIVSSRSAGAVTSLVVTVPDTVTVLSGACTPLSTAVMVTWPVLCVAPSAKLSVGFALSSKSAGTAGAFGCADTVTANGAAAACDTVAVTRLTPPSSAISCSDSASTTRGGPSVPGPTTNSCDIA